MDKSLPLIDLHTASENGDVEAVSLYCEQGYNLNTVDSQRKTALHLSSENGHVDVTQLLLEANCVVNAKDNFGNTALHYAAREWSQ